MSKRGRPLKNRSLFTVKNFIEYTSDSESDSNNVRQNIRYEVKKASLQTILRNRGEVDQQQEREENIDQHELLDRQDGQANQDTDQPLREVQEEDQDLDRPDGQANLEDTYQPIHERLEEDHDVRNNDPDPHQDGQPIHQVQEKENYVDEQQENEPISEAEQQEEGENEENNYNTILEKLKSQWLLTEIHHSVSKSASEEFWKVALTNFTLLAHAEGRKKKPNQFKTIRRRIYEDLLPSIDLQIGFKNKISGQIVVVNDIITPLKNYPPSRFEKLFEIGTVKVS